MGIGGAVRLDTQVLRAACKHSSGVWAGGGAKQDLTIDRRAHPCYYIAIRYIVIRYSAHRYK